jgi:hypothetical protein
MTEPKPHVPADSDLKDFSLKALLVGAVFGILFGSANAYLGLRVGLTISTAIPLAVIVIQKKTFCISRWHLHKGISAGQKFRIKTLNTALPCSMNRPDRNKFDRRRAEEHKKQNWLQHIGGEFDTGTCR